MEPLRTFTVCGMVTAALFQQCAEAAQYLNERCGHQYRVSVFEEVPRDFAERRAAMVASDKLNDAHAEVIVITADGVGQSGEAFLADVQQHTGFKLVSLDATHPDSYTSRGQLAWRRFLRGRGNAYCWLSVHIGDTAAGRIVVELFTQVAPRTCFNFLYLCRGEPEVAAGDVADEKAKDDVVAPPRNTVISYRNTTFFRIMKDAWVMAGDVSAGHTGNGGSSCYGRYFADECFAVPHDAPGVLGMCNDGPNTNASSFYITRKKMSWMNGRYVAFGRVIDGMDVVDAIHNVEVKHNQAPRQRITIVDCGEIDVTM